MSAVKKERRHAPVYAHAPCFMPDVCPLFATPRRDEKSSAFDAGSFSAATRHVRQDVEVNRDTPPRRKRPPP